LKPGPARRVDPGPGRPGPEPGRVDEKMEEGKTRCDPADPAGRPGQDQVTNSLTFVFFLFFLLKRRRFDFFKKN